MVMNVGMYTEGLLQASQFARRYRLVNVFLPLHNSPKAGKREKILSEYMVCLDSWKVNTERR